MKTFYWLVKREFWEHRGSFLWAPVISAGILLLLTIMGVIAGETFRNRAGIHFGNGINLEVLRSSLDDGKLDTIGRILDVYMMSPAMLISIVLFVVVFFYCVNALAEDRRDRSILFWKSLPLSDRETVLSKVFCAGVLAPVIAIVVSVIAGLAMLLLVALVAAAHGLGLQQMLWTLPHPFRITFDMLASLPLYLVWALPTIGWLMLCSAWARSKTFLWAVGLPIGSGVLVTWFNQMGSIGVDTLWYWRNIVGRALLGVIPGTHLSPRGAFGLSSGSMDEKAALLLLKPDYAQFITAPFLVGAVAGIAMIAAAIWLRRWRTEL